MRTRRIAQLVAAGCVAVATATLAGCGSDEPAPEQSAVEAPAVDPAAPPEQVTWQNYREIALPVSAVSGPKQSSTAATGFEQSGQGAGLAAIQTSVRMSVAPDEQWTEIARESIAPGPGRDAFMVNRAQVSVDGQGTDEEFRPTIRGYTVDEYSPERAVISVVTEYSDGSLLSTRQEVVWRDGDWKLVIADPEGGSAASRSIEQVPESMTVVEE